METKEATPVVPDGDEFKRLQEDIDQENRMAIRLLAMAGISISVISFVTHLIAGGLNKALLQSCWLGAYFLLLLFLEKYVFPKCMGSITVVVYLIEAPVMLISILLGTVWDPNRQAITILLFLIAMPVFILDRPLRLLLVQAFWCALFLILAHSCKSTALFESDLTHILEFYMTSVAVIYVMTSIRMKGIHSREQLRYSLEHDSETNCLSRYALANHTERYTGKPVIILFADLDKMTFLNDFYGHKVGEAISLFFAHTLKEGFENGDTYRYGTDEILCVVPGGTEAGCLEQVARCRRALENFQYEGKSIFLSCSFGYVTGTPSDSSEFQEMIRLADIYAHKVKLEGMNRSYGSPFDHSHLMEEIAGSDAFSHARAHETHQLTGLPGMSYFVANCDELMGSVVNLSREPVIGYFKILHMRSYNNKFGYAEGDELIKEMAFLLRSFFHHRQIAHITSGQFAVLCYKEEVETAVEGIVRRLELYRKGTQVTIKAGFAEYSGQEKAIILLDKAKQAQKSIQRRNDTVVCFYNSQMDEENTFHHYIINHVDEAIENGYLQVYYQPIARSITGEVCNEEALSRWDDPEYGFLAPYRFIPTLEANGLMYRINLHVVRQVMKDLKRKMELGLPCVPISVNLSRRDFDECDMVEEISSIVDEASISRDLLKIEITESAFIASQAKMKSEVKRFRKAGFEVWLDDFGSEYSTLNLLQDMDFDLIKIDMQFMKNFAEGGKNYIIVSDIIDMAKRMGITTLIEGVETMDQYRLIRRIGCEKIQGYLFNKPNPLEYIIERAQSRTGLRFERPESVTYYERIGRIDLHSPMSAVDEQDRVHFTSEIPSGIIERRKGSYFCLRATDSFLRILEEWAELPEQSAEKEPQPSIPEAPDSMAQGADLCETSDSWVNVKTTLKREGPLVIYFRKVASCAEGGCLAFMVVMLHA